MHDPQPNSIDSHAETFTMVWRLTEEKSAMDYASVEISTVKY